MTRSNLLIQLGLAIALSGPALHAGTAEALQTIRAVGPEGQGNVTAANAWTELANANARELPDILAAMDNANPLAMNWLRSAVEDIVQREATAGRALPVANLEKFVAEKTHNPRARRLAYELIAHADPAKADALIGSMLNDPSTELRRDAVQKLMTEAAATQAGANKSGPISRYQSALKAARDIDQIEAIAKALTSLGQPPSLPEVFGWLNSWQVIGPFDNTGGAGYELAFPPEKEIDFAAEYDGKSGKVRWKPYVSTNDYGKIDLNKPLGMLKEVTGYAATEIHSDSAREVELRLGCKNGWKVWLNGELLFSRDEYHRGTEIDHFRLKARLKPGRNVILVKVTQNEQIEDWTVEWEFQMRITDELGSPIVFARK